MTQPDRSHTFLSDTPRTDAIEHPFRQKNDQTYTAMLEHARTLERELALLSTPPSADERQRAIDYANGYATAMETAAQMLEDTEGDAPEGTHAYRLLRIIVGRIRALSSAPKGG